ncbi:MAG TPA: endonuclease/exonuclease/phosphatase family protein [Candidatus Saccharimonadales bacterium]|nr:endonuclease/exonuclease/phosphatase family protein [Candidatus Saccharimonadales bacterium]
MKVATHNLFEGAQGTIPLLVQYVREQDLDILCLQEVNGWQDGDPTMLEQFAAMSGLRHYVFGDSNTDYKLATFSRLPFTETEVLRDGFWHCAVRVTVDYGGEPLDVWNVHHDPRSEDGRVPEAAIICGAGKPGRSRVVTGDINSLSRRDKYSPSLLEVLAAQGITKFGTDELLYKVTDYYTSHGFKDAAVELGNLETTVPTPANKDMFHAAPMRLDYFFVTNALVPDVRAISVPKNKLTDKISDHYGAVLTLA